MLTKSTSRLDFHRDNWFKKAEVKNAASFEIMLPFEHNRIDFLPELLPFNQHPYWQSQPVELKNKVLSYGWMMYNMRTIHIETKIVGPFCQDVINHQVGIVKNYQFESLLAQTLVDEAYHVLISIEGCESVLRNRRLPRLELPMFKFHQKIKEFLSKAHSQQEQELIMFGVVVVSEVLISAYLSSISNSAIVQPLLRHITYIHWRDELAHGGVFRHIVDKVFDDLSDKNQAFLLDVIEQANEWFTDPELEIWRYILEQCNIDYIDEILDGRLMTSNKVSHQLAFAKINRLISNLDKKIVGIKWKKDTNLMIKNC